MGGREKFTRKNKEARQWGVCRCVAGALEQDNRCGHQRVQR